jgi:hypothetical protein
MPRTPVTITARGIPEAARNGIIAAAPISESFSCLYHLMLDLLRTSYQRIWSSRRSMIRFGTAFAVVARSWVPQSRALDDSRIVHNVTNEPPARAFLPVGIVQRTIRRIAIGSLGNSFDDVRGCHIRRVLTVRHAQSTQVVFIDENWTFP